MTEEVKNEKAVESVESVDAVSSGDEVLADAEPDNGLAKGDSPDFKWYVANVLSNYEARVTKTLKENILNHKMTEYFAEILVPEENVVTNVNGKKRNIVIVDKDIEEKDIKDLIIKQKLIEKYTNNKEINKTIYVKNRLINYII